MIGFDGKMTIDDIKVDWDLQGDIQIDTAFYSEPDIKTSIEDFDRLVECWGNTHVLENKEIKNIGDRTMFIYEFKCGRTFQTGHKIVTPEITSMDEKPENSCPGCCPSMKEVRRW